MSDETRIHALLEEMLDSNRTPEDVCAGDPELLREVRAQWEKMRRVAYQIDELFPADDPTRPEDSTSPGFDVELPQIDGYAVDGVLGRGGIGVVFKARQLKLNRDVALKMLLSGHFAGPVERARFRREAEAVAALRHPNIVQVYDAGEVAGRNYFTMELIDGGSLAEQLAGKPQSARAAAELVATLAGALQFAHANGFIHRDLKPGNILLTNDGVPKITDFGLARSIDAGPEFTLTGVRVGTPSYMAPEQALGKASAISPAVDIYALGAVLYEMLTGRPPFQGESAAEIERRVIGDEPAPPSRLNPRVPRDLETICLKCLHKQPQRRYASAAALADDLECFLRGEAIAARPQGRIERLARTVRRRPILMVSLTASVLLASSLVGGGLWVRWEQAANELTQAQLDRVNQARRDQEFVARLDAIRLNRTAVIDGSFDTLVSTRANRDQADRAYEAAFRDAAFGEVRDDPQLVAARLEASNMRGALAAALDDWAACVTADERRLHNWLEAHILRREAEALLLPATRR